MRSDSSTDFGRKIAFLRKKLGYSQAEFAQKVGRSETWVSQVERGVRRIDRMSVLERVADALDTEVGVTPEKSWPPHRQGSLMPLLS
ncbi:helix-turn-helix transcriptional regulator [Pseudonocardia sp. ICBG1142]|uniref:helix-turn-helix domain-containing protein n=1 Tax=Pseudonocardia sp. ICBG1142 TaxID=2846760 RepID=UPI001CF639B1